MGGSGSSSRERKYAGLRGDLGELECENAGLRNGLKDASGWHCGQPLTSERRGKVKNAGLRSEFKWLGRVAA